MDSEMAKKILGCIDDEEIVKLEQALVRIPSLTYEETELAEYLAEYMRHAGIEVEMHEVTDPLGSGRKSKQPVGRIRGSGEGPSLMFNGHMDHNALVGEWPRDPFSGEIEGDWLYGRGSIDEKGGITGFVMAGVAIQRSGLKLKGDLVLCPVMGHKSGGVGTQYNLEHGITADMAIITENADLEVVTRGVGLVKVKITFAGHSVHFRTPDKKLAANPIEKLAKFVVALGAEKRPIEPGGWLTFEPDPGLPGYPQFGLDAVICQRVPESFCSLEMQIRGGQRPDAETVRQDLEKLIDGLQASDPTLKASVEVLSYSPPYETSEDEPVVTALVKWHEFVVGQPPPVGAGLRLGALADANILANAGITSVQYGPGRHGMFKQWPAPDERIYIPELIAGAKVMALTAADICGAH